MRKTKVNKIKRFKRIIKGLLLLGITTTSLLYIIYIIGVATITYLSNRPIRQAVLYVVFGCLLMVYDTIEDNKRRAKARQQRLLLRRQQQLLQQNKTKGGAF